MKVRLKGTYIADYPDISPDASYLVIENLADGYRILNRNRRPFLFVKEAFEVVDSENSRFWVSIKHPDGETDRTPKQFAEPGFFELFFDGEPRAVATFWLVYRAMAKYEKNREYLYRCREMIVAGYRKYDPFSSQDLGFKQLKYGEKTVSPKRRNHSRTPAHC